jgi:hypothetical protein
MLSAELTLSAETLSPAGSVDPPVLNGTLESPLKVPVVSSPGLTGFLGCVLDDSWPVKEDIVAIFSMRFVGGFDV